MTMLLSQPDYGQIEARMDIVCDDLNQCAEYAGPPQDTQWRNLWYWARELVLNERGFTDEGHVSFSDAVYEGNELVSGGVTPGELVDLHREIEHHFRAEKDHAQRWLLDHLNPENLPTPLRENALRRVPDLNRQYQSFLTPEWREMVDQHLALVEDWYATPLRKRLRRGAAEVFQYADERIEDMEEMQGIDPRDLSFDYQKLVITKAITAMAFKLSSRILNEQKALRLLWELDKAIEQDCNSTGAASVFQSAYEDDWRHPILLGLPASNPELLSLWWRDVGERKRIPF
tara:strand:+ start:221 stop:1084 length:864 start_codon:yes stop_codon:yes gene_type:complete